MALSENLIEDEYKGRVQTALVSCGMVPMTAYNRLFRRGHAHGFEPWEERGIYGCMEDYTGYALSDLQPLETFYARMKGKDKFCQFMRERGLGKNSVIKRFRRWDFQPWELLGVNNIVERVF